MYVTTISHNKYWRVDATVKYPGKDAIKLATFFVMVDETPQPSELKPALDVRAEKIAKIKAKKIINPLSLKGVRGTLKVSRMAGQYVQPGTLE